MSLIIWLSLGLWALNWAIMGWGTWLVYSQFSRVSKRPISKDCVPVSILKPLKGIDEGLSGNLESFFQLDYPKYEILFSVRDQHEPAIPLVQKLMAKYPHVDAQLSCSPGITGPNPKINNLVSVYDQAKYDAILISDSNIRVKPDYLNILVPDLNPKVGIITAIVAGTAPINLGGWLEASYLNTFFARWMVVTKRLGFPSVIGKSMIFKKSILKRVGGLRNLNHYIAEDYMAGHAIEKLDLTVELMRSPVDQFIGNYSFKQFWARHIRWGRIRKSIAPVAFLAEPFFFSTLSGAVGALALSSRCELSFLKIWILHMSAWAILDAFLYHRIDRFSFKALGAWIIREGLGPFLWFSILCGNTVFWRGKKYQLLQGGLLDRGVLT